MIAGLKAYPERRNSGADWLGEVPGHWQVVPLGSLLTIRSEKGRTDLPLLSVLREKGVVRRSDLAADENHNVMPDDLAAYKVARGGDLVINKMKAWQGSLGLAPCDGVVSPAYFVFDLASSNIRFAERMLRSRHYVDQFARASDGVRIGQWDLGIPAMKRIACVVPPEDEQAAIVRFLDHADRRVRRSIAAKQKMIRLLEEQKAAIIHQAVTRGLNPDAPIKPSGVDWLGDIPAHWEVTRVKDEFQNLNTRRIPLSATARGEMTERSFDYYGASGVIDRVDDFLFDEDLLLIAEDGANLVLRNLPLAIIARGKFWVNNHAHILRPKRGSLDYLAHYMEGIRYQPWITGAAQPKLTMDRLMAIKVAVAPPDEQHAIVAVVAAQTTELRKAIALARNEVILWNEYRTRLVADVVTGKLDARAAAAQLDIVDSEEDEPVDGENIEPDNKGFDEAEADEEFV
ncbi:MAG: hypothetical protein DI531_04105 [Brevundimonas sp.]|uniref:restriction endonuclease subunit S n=1 Tax=Brevundimonas sp. TaxID=1871086 RepID=UPI000DAF7881|nr:restriction endonuclease subunit S [Brevundimonas sp.]PZU75806.1 MAG: hypothetical protein DI531_04105 [Brevundimonas sp.]